MQQIDYKLRQRISKILPHCPSILYAEIYKKFTNNNNVHVYMFKLVFDNLKWFIENRFYDLTIELYNYTYNKSSYRDNEYNYLAELFPVEVAIGLIKLGVIDSKKLFIAAIEANNFELVKAIHSGGWPINKVLELDLPSSARLDYMERGLNIHTGVNNTNDCLVNYLFVNDLIYQFQPSGMLNYDMYGGYGLLNC